MKNQLTHSNLFYNTDFAPITPIIFFEWSLITHSKTPNKVKKTDLDFVIAPNVIFVIFDVGWFIPFKKIDEISS